MKRNMTSTDFVCFSKKNFSIATTLMHTTLQILGLLLKHCTSWKVICNSDQRIFNLIS